MGRLRLLCRVLLSGQIRTVHGVHKRQRPKSQGGACSKATCGVHCCQPGQPRVSAFRNAISNSPAESAGPTSPNLTRRRGAKFVRTPRLQAARKPSQSVATPCLGVGIDCSGPHPSCGPVSLHGGPRPRRRRPEVSDGCLPPAQVPLQVLLIKPTRSSRLGLTPQASSFAASTDVPAEVCGGKTSQNGGDEQPPKRLRRRSAETAMVGSDQRAKLSTAKHPPSRSRPTSTARRQTQNVCGAGVCLAWHEGLREASP